MATMPTSLPAWKRKASIVIRRPRLRTNWLLGFLTFAVVSASPVFAAPEVLVRNYDETTEFTGEPVVLVQKGDVAEYADPDYDDSQWSVVALPSEWSDLYPDYNGITWYRIHFRLPSELPPRGLGVRLGVITDADEVYFNGEFVGGAGRIDEPHESAYDKERLYELPTGLVNRGGDNVVAIRVRGLFSYSNGPFTGKFALGSIGELQSELLTGEYLSLFPIIVYVIVAAYFFLFFARRPEDRANLLFALFALAMGAYFAMRTQANYLIGMDFFVAKKLEYLLLATLVVLLTEFLTFYLKKRHTIAHFIFLGITAVHVLVFLVSNNYVFWDTYNQYVQLPSWLLGVVLCFIMLISSYRQDRDARLMLFALGVLLITMINDVLVNMVVYDFPRLSSYGFVFFVGAIAAILSNRFVRLHGEVEDLNRNLELRVEERTNELNRTVSDLELAKAETDNLLHNVQEGIFLLDHEHIIGDHHSTMLKSIFEKEELGGASFVDLVQEVVDSETAGQTGEFLDIALTKKLSDKRLKMLNPVNEVRAVVTKDAETVEKFLRINFTRIGAKNAYSHLLGTVQDVTEEKRLERRVQQSEERAQEEMKVLLGILHLSPDVVRRFLDEARTEIANLEKTLQSAGYSEDLRELLNSVFRSVHSIKGNASVLGLELFTQQAHDFEDKIRELFAKENLTALDLLGLLYSIVGLKEALTQVEDLLGRIAGFQDEFGGDDATVDERGILMQTARDLVQRVAEREAKDVKVEFASFEVPEDDSIDHQMVKNVLIQLVKNSAVHGIESPDDRESAGKPRSGTITVEASTSDNEVVIAVQDDGRGIQLGSIRDRAVAAGLHTAEEMEGWTTLQLAQLVFATGLSTQAETSLDAGRGVGLDLVRHEVREAGGKISLSFKTGVQTRFTVRLPRRTES
jgi:HPt (histidine-containing phosphotransfer) domain-containing protein